MYVNKIGGFCISDRFSIELSGNSYLIFRHVETYIHTYFPIYYIYIHVYMYQFNCWSHMVENGNTLWAISPAMLYKITYGWEFFIVLQKAALIH